MPSETRKSTHDLWADAHVFYNLYNHPTGLRGSEIDNCEKRWRQRIVEQTPNGSLFRYNALFEFLKGPRVSMLHVTPNNNFKKCAHFNTIYPSGGCLVGSIYCTILTLEPHDTDRYRVHNLGQYITETELPRRLHFDQNNPVVPIIIEGDLQPTACNLQIG